MPTPRFSLTLPNNSRPWPLALPKTHWVSTRFDHGPVGEQDFFRYRIPLPPSLHHASAKRRAEFLAGRWCAQRALWMLNGKECVPGMRQDRAPQWPPGCVGSITHSDTWAAALVAYQTDYLALGLDVEHCLSNSEGKKLAPGILTAAERAHLSRLAPEQLGLMVTLIFSVKESLFKALYPVVGIRFYFADAELTEWNMTTGRARLRLLCHLGPAWPRGKELDARFYHAEQHIFSLVALPAQNTGIQD